MTNHILSRAISLASAAIVTASMLAGIDVLAAREHAVHQLMAQAGAAGLLA
jgi:hypothetical protein